MGGRSPAAPAGTSSSSGAKSISASSRASASSELLPPAVVETPELALELAERLARLGARLGIDEIGQTLRRGEVQTAIQERPPGELARLRRPQPRQIGQRREERSADRAATVDLELQHVLAGEARGRREPEHEAAIEHLASRRGPRANAG